MRDVKTVDRLPAIKTTDPLIAKQVEDVAKMRTSLLCCSEDSYSVQKSLKNVSVLQVQYQFIRIIRCLDAMNKIDDKMYEALDYRLDTIDVRNTTAWDTLMRMQAQLQKNMMEGCKLLEPYSNMPNLFIDEVESIQTNNDGNTILSKASRDRLRTGAQQVLELIVPMSENGGDTA
jgi:hypothetical protein